jgi:hypothetical protein
MSPCQREFALRINAEVTCLRHGLLIVYWMSDAVESATLLSAINWAWHCFVDRDSTNVYASSVTIYEGEERTNILNEDFHVVHHQYPGAHWSDHPALYKKHYSEYVANRATCFKKTHAVEIFFMAILKVRRWVLRRAPLLTVHQNSGGMGEQGGCL